MNEESLFAAALAKGDAAERQAFLDQACADDAALRQRVEQLLAADQQSAGILERGPDDVAPQTRPAQPGLATDRVFAGRFKLRQKLGEGGMGEVWVADQTEPVRRRVALKVVRPGYDSARMLARFDQERQALALMDHPNIAKVLDAGVTDGQPYFVMELIKGVSITQYCDEVKLSPRARLGLFVPVCEAVQHAHQKGIIHRDLKPSNILVALYDGKPVPKVIDFGVAKASGPRLTALSVYTEVGSLVGTLEYMSPEQAELNSLDVDTRTDVYALGVLLYELLVGSVPFSRRELQAAAFTDMLRLIKEVDPPRPSTRLSGSGTLPSVAAVRQTEPKKLIALVRGELDWIIMKCLEKDRNRRYATANGLARDIQRYLSGEAVEACPPSTAYRLRKFVGKYRSVLATAGAFVLLLVAAALASSWQAFRATKAESEARQSELRAGQAQAAAQDERQQAVTNLYHARIEEAAALRRARDVGYRTQVFNRLQQALQLDTPDKDRDQLRDEAVACLGDFVGLEPITWVNFSAGIRAIALTPDGEQIAIALDNGTIQLRQVSTGQVVAELSESALGLGIDKANRWLVNAGAKGTIKVWQDYGASGGPAVHTIEMRADFAGMSLNGRFAVGSSHERDGRSLSLWDIAGREVKARLKVPSGEPEGPLQVNDDGTCVAQASRSGTKLYALVWNAPKPEPKKIFFADTNQDTQALAISADGRFLACQHGDDGLILLDVIEGVPRPVIRDHEVLAACFSRDRRYLLYYSASWGAKLWEVANHREVAALEHSGGGITCSAAFSADGNTFATANPAARSMRVWRLAGASEKLVLDGHGGGVADLAFRPDGKVLASASKDRLVKLWDVASGQLLSTLPPFESSIQTIDFSPDGRLLATAQFGPAAQPVQVWDLATLKAFVPPDDELGQVAYGVAFSPDGKILAACGDGLTLWRIAEGERGAGNPPRLSFQRLVHLPGFRSLYVRISPNGKLLAWTDRHLLVCLWDLANGREIPFTGPLGNGWRNLAFYPDSDHLTFSTIRGTIEAWDTRTARSVFSFGRGSSVAASLDGSWLAAGQDPASGDVPELHMALWNKAGSRLFALPQERLCWSYALSSDGEKLVVGLADGGLAIWNVPLIQAQLARIGLAWQGDARATEQQAPKPFVPATPRERQLQIMHYANLGKRLAWVGRVAEAEDAYRNAVKVKPDDPQAHASFGKFLDDQGRHREAEVELSQAIELQPERGLIWAQRGWAYAGSGQWDKVSADFVKATFLVQRGWAYAGLEQWEKASADFVRATQCKEPDEEAWYSQAMLYLRYGNLDQYRKVCADMLQRFGAGATWTCTLTPHSGADPKRIVDLAEKLLAKSSRDHWHVSQLGAALYRADRIEDAVKRLTEATELNAHPYRTNMLCTWFFLAMAHHRLGHSAESSRWLEKANRATDEALKPQAKSPENSIAGTVPPNWAQKLTLQLLRREAEKQLGRGEPGTLVPGGKSSVRKRYGPPGANAPGSPDAGASS
jgi:WD40 repeat protein/tetratricopeptide (TPR) repeat protein